MNTKPQDAHYETNDPEEGRVVEETTVHDNTSGALALITRTEIDRQIATARHFPRSLTGFRRDVTDFATQDPIVAASMFYALPRAGKTIEGPSARFAEIALSCWGNCSTGGRVVDIGDQFITAQGVFYDMQKNVRITYEVMRRITDSKGAMFSPDMIVVTGNAATSIALRNAVLKGIPKAFWGEAYEKARSVVAGDVKTLANRRADMIQAFAVFGVKKEQIYGILGVKGPEDILTDHIVILAGIYTAIKEKDTTAEEAFSVDKMKNPGEVVPPRPVRGNAFEGGGDRAGAAAGKKTVGKTPTAKAKDKAAGKTGAADGTKGPEKVGGEGKPAEGAGGTGGAGGGADGGTASGAGAPAQAGSGGTAAKTEAPAWSAEEQGAIERGRRLLSGMKSATEVDELHASIVEELTTDPAKAQWHKDCAEKKAELEQAAGQ